MQENGSFLGLFYNQTIILLWFKFRIKHSGYISLFLNSMNPGQKYSKELIWVSHLHFLVKFQQELKINTWNLKVLINLLKVPHR